MYKVLTSVLVTALFAGIALTAPTADRENLPAAPAAAVQSPVIFVTALTAGAGFQAAPQTAAPPVTNPAPATTGPSASPDGSLHLPTTTDAGAQKAGQLLQQMVTALGGTAYLSMRDMEQEGRTYRFYHGEPQGTGALFWRFWKWPDKDRMELTKQRDWIVLFVGDQGYEITFRGTTAVEKDQLEDYLRRRSHSLLWVLRTWLDQPGVALFYEGQAVAERKQADQVSIITSGNDAVTISIDSNTHLPLRVAFSWRDPVTRDRNDDAEGYDNYRPIQGIMTPFSIIRYHNGDPSTQRFITSTKYNQNPPDSLFVASIRNESLPKTKKK